jgi:hypothetical protein
MQCLARDPRQAPERFLAPISSICTTAFQNWFVISISRLGIPLDFCACGFGPGLTFPQTKAGAMASDQWVVKDESQ